MRNYKSKVERIKAVLFIGMLLVAGACCQAQTTMDEYLYCTKGFRETRDMGMGTKSGYRIEKIAPAQAKYGTYEMDKLVNEGTGKVKALIIVYWKGDMINHYFCICAPGTASDVAERAFGDWVTYFNGIGQVSNVDGEMILYSLACTLVMDLKQ